MPCAFHYRPSDSNDAPDIGCQFDIPENELIGTQGSRWCEFHVPKYTSSSENSGLVTLAGTWSKKPVEEFNSKIISFIDSSLSTHLYRRERFVISVVSFFQVI